ncbi:MAG: Ribonuclease Y [Mycoplasmataceae bacterium]|nr:MAG: Ribonuclease Y [Mycoplasmataceae bacterium]
MIAFLAFLAKPAIAGLVKWAIGAAVTYFVAKPVIEKWGSTPNNRAEKLGITNEDALGYAQANRKDKLKFVQEKAEELNEELKEEIEKLKEEINKLEKRLLKETEEWKDPNNTPAEKAQKFAIMQNTQGELESKRKEKKSKEQEIKKNDKEVASMFDELTKGAEKLTEIQLKNKNNAPDLGSWLNWGIIAIGVITAVLIVKFIFGIFKKFNKEIT